MNVQIARNIPSDAQRTFQQIIEELEKMEVPLLKEMRSVRALKEGSSAYFHDREANKISRYTKLAGRLIEEVLYPTAPDADAAESEEVVFYSSEFGET